MEKTLLVIEDDPDDLFFIKKSLTTKSESESEGAEFQIETCSLLADGLEALGKNKFDCILLDLGLPDSWGLDTFDKVLEVNSSVPVIILTSMNDEAIAFMAREKGARNYFVKSVQSYKNLADIVDQEISAGGLSPAAGEEIFTPNFGLELWNRFLSPAVILNSEDEILLANPKFCQKFSLSESEVVGKQFDAEKGQVLGLGELSQDVDGTWETQKLGGTGAAQTLVLFN